MQKFPVSEIYDALEIIMKYYPDNFNEQSKTELEALLDHCLLGIDESSNKFLTILFIKALKNHIGLTSIDEHIYLKKYDLPQIKLFDLIIQHFPFVKGAHKITNELLANNIREKEHIFLIDIGIGRGLQIVNLLNHIAYEGSCKLKKITILGIEPFTDAIKIAETTIKDAAAKLNFDVEFIAWNILIEEVSLYKLNEIIPQNVHLVINESLTLHHIQDSVVRNRILKDLRTLNPQAFILTEPNVNHFESNFLERFRNSYQHFFHVFKTIDGLEINKHDKNALKLFFGREIEDIIGKQETDRYEKHEPATEWIKRLKESGFKINCNFQNLHIDCYPNIKIEYKNEFLGFTHEEETVLSIIYAET